MLNYLHTHVTNVLLHICKLCRILHVLITMYTSSLDQKVVGKNSNRNFCYHNRCWNSCFNNDFWNICSDKSCWNSCFNKSCWNSHQRNFVPAIIGGTVVPTMIVGTAVPTIIVLTAYYWKSCGGQAETHKFWDRQTHTHRHTEVHIEVVPT